jgi:hypothetical protein
MYTVNLSEGPPVAAYSTRADLPPQLRALSARAQDLRGAIRDALRATLSVAAHNATPEQVLSDTFARLGYLPEETKQATRKLLAQPAQGRSELRYHSGSQGL